MRPKVWWVVASDKRPEHAWHWDQFFDDPGDPDEAFDWGGPDWIRSAVSFPRIEDMREGDVVVAYQAGDGVVGLARLASDGLVSESSGNYDTFDLARAPVVHLEEPIPYPLIQELPNAGEHFDFVRFRQATVFGVSHTGARRLADLARRLNPEQVADIDLVLEDLPATPDHWWVNHGQTQDQEIEGGYMWSPKQNRDGSRNESYLNLTRVAIGDVVYSYADGKIGFVGVVEAACRDASRPTEFGTVGDQWDVDGWLVPVSWTRLASPFEPSLHMDALAPLLPQTYSPVRADGKGNQGIYLAAIGQAMGQMLTELAQETDPGISGRLDAARQYAEASAAEAEIQAAEDLTETEKTGLAKSRRGQGLFRQRVESIERGCRLTGTTDLRFLTASHIKPWCKCNNAERLDGHNGLLLAPHVDRLFDGGWITFTDEGAVLCADSGVTSVLNAWGIDANQDAGSFSDRQREYLKYHRRHRFKGSEPL